MRIAFTIADASDSALSGGEVQRTTATVVISDDLIPQIVKDFLKARESDREPYRRLGQYSYQSMSISLIDER